jgi:hypothetical protein
MGACPVHQNGMKSLKEPLKLKFGQQLVQLSFDCKKCEMRLEFENA